MMDKNLIALIHRFGIWCRMPGHFRRKHQSGSLTSSGEIDRCWLCEGYRWFLMGKSLSYFIIIKIPVHADGVPCSMCLRMLEMVAPPHIAMSGNFWQSHLQTSLPAPLDVGEEEEEREKKRCW